jgi:hypothetical protein
MTNKCVLLDDEIIGLFMDLCVDIKREGCAETRELTGKEGNLWPLTFNPDVSG